MITIAKRDNTSNRREDDTRINSRITARECRLIDENGDQMGIMATRDALDIADERGYDLVEISPNAEPPVCRIMDYGKFKYEKQKKARDNRKNSKQTQTKEMKFRCRIGDGDYNTKKKHIERFIADGCNVKVTIMFRGREMSHPDIGLELLTRLSDDLEGKVSVISAPNMEGRNMTMVIAPLVQKAK